MNTHRMEIDLSDPMTAGTKLAREMVIPVMAGLEEQLDNAETVKLWAGLLASLAGRMAAAVGADGTAAVLETLQHQVQQLGDEPPARSH
jgi:hypothetical protein